MDRGIMNHHSFASSVALEKKSTPAVSVIVPNYNHARFLRQRLDSILNQTFQDFELILLDDCSTDDSVAVLREYASHSRVSHFLVNSVNSGSPFAQWSRGLRLALGEYVWIAESDDVAEVTFLEKLLPPLRAQTDVAISAAACRVIDGTGTVITAYSLHDSNPSLFQGMSGPVTLTGRHFIRDCMQWGSGLTNASGLLVRRSVLSSIELPVKMRYCGDTITWLRALERAKLAYSPEYLNLWRSHDSTTRALNTTGEGEFYINTVKNRDYLAEMILIYIETERILGKSWDPGPLRFAMKRWKAINEGLIRWFPPHIGLWLRIRAITQSLRVYGWPSRLQVARRLLLEAFSVSNERRYDA